jgi:transcriptional regulator GlxA family with amidase domain
MARLDELEAEVGAAGPDGGPLAEAVDEVRSGRHPTADVLAGRTTYVRRLVDGEDGSALGLADQAIVAVHRRLEEAVQPADIADELCVSLRTLERGLATVLDCTPRQLILAMKMREARRLLETEDLTVSEVAYRLGFSSPGHFSRRFSAFYREPPSAVRSRAAA